MLVDYYEYTFYALILIELCTRRHQFTHIYTRVYIHVYMDAYTRSYVQYTYYTYEHWYLPTGIQY